MPILQIPGKLKRILTTKARIITLIGGRGSAKSESVARILVMKAQTEGADILCGREYQNSIDDSVHKLLAELVDTLDVSDAFSVTEKRIDCIGGGGFRFKGFSRNSEAVKSAQGFKYSWIEEAQTLSQKSIDDLIPTIRKGGSQLFFTANPLASGDPFSQRFILPFKDEIERYGYYEDDMHLVIAINWRDNPWHGELEQQRQWDFANLPRAKYDHIWEGAFNDHIDNAIIEPEWFDAAVDAHEKLGFSPRGAKVVAFDPADTGEDAKALCLRHGSVILHAEDWLEGDANDGCDRATDYAIQNGANVFTWDCDGLGVTLRRQVSGAFKGTGIDYQMFKGSEGVERPDDIYLPDEDAPRATARTNKQTFKNRRAQRVWRLRDRYYNTYRAVERGDYVDPDEMICLSSEIKCLDRLRTETCRVPLKPNGSGLIQIMGKEEMMAKHGIASPNLFDATFMSLTIPKPAKRERKPITVPSVKYN